MSDAKNCYILIDLLALYGNKMRVAGSYRYVTKMYENMQFIVCSTKPTAKTC